MTYTAPTTKTEAIERMREDGDADPEGTARLNYPHLFAAPEGVEPVAWLDMRIAPLPWQDRVVATNPEYVTNNGPENFVALVPASPAPQEVGEIVADDATIEKVAQALAGDEWNAKNFNETLNGDDPEGVREHWRDTVRNVIFALNESGSYRKGGDDA